ncbi:MAG: hypothetical protein M3458_23440 [Acidobacteriota bacterium]|nr:hypothetical protein [Acidobacteriota bacterium]
MATEEAPAHAGEQRGADERDPQLIRGVGLAGANALDPDEFVRHRTILGGPAPEETRALDAERIRECTDSNWYDEKLVALTRAHETLLALTNRSYRDS